MYFFGAKMSIRQLLYLYTTHMPRRRPRTAEEQAAYNEHRRMERAHSSVKYSSFKASIDKENVCCVCVLYVLYVSCAVCAL
jgi:hypothetical protein